MEWINFTGQQPLLPWTSSSNRQHSTYSHWNQFKVISLSKFICVILKATFFILLSYFNITDWDLIDQSESYWGSRRWWREVAASHLGATSYSASRSQRWVIACCTSPFIQHTSVDGLHELLRPHILHRTHTAKHSAYIMRILIKFCQNYDTISLIEYYEHFGRNVWLVSEDVEWWEEQPSCLN